ncbi:MAG: DUF5686 family protein [Bacteroidota bacterium]
MIKSSRFAIFFCLIPLIVNHLRGQVNPSIIPADSAVVIASQASERKATKLSVQQLLFSGALFSFDEGRKSIYLPPVTNILSANTVESYVVDFRPSYTNKLEEGKFFYLRPGLRYGFGNERFGAELLARYFYHPATMSSVEVSGGRYTKQLNEQSRLAQNIYTSYPLLSEDNYLKVYEKSYLQVSHTTVPVKDLLLTGTLSWNQRNPLENLPEYADGEFTPNAPENIELDNTTFSRHQLALLSVGLSWQANTSYTHQRGRFITEGKGPRFSLYYSRAIPDFLGSNLDYSKVALRINGSLREGNLGKGRFELEAGDFIGKERLTFIDFHHFNGNRLVINNTHELGSFQLLDYYTYSTQGAYLRAHYEHRWKGVKVREEEDLFQPVVSFNYLMTQQLDAYVELGVGLDRILGKWRLEAYLSMQELSYDRFGMRLGFVFE